MGVGAPLWGKSWIRHCFVSIDLITARYSSCGKVMFSLACVKNSVNRGYVYPTHATPTPQPCTPTQVCMPPGHAHSPGMHARWGMHAPPRHACPPGHVCTLQACTPPTDTTRCSQCAGNTHPTGMHSCLNV